MAQIFSKYTNYNDYLNDVNNGKFNDLGVSIHFIRDLINNVKQIDIRKGLHTSSELVQTLDYKKIYRTEKDHLINYWVANDGAKIYEAFSIIKEYLSKKDLEEYIRDFPNYYLAFISDNDKIEGSEDIPLYKINMTEYNILPPGATDYGLFDNENNKIGKIDPTTLASDYSKEPSEYYYSIGCLADTQHDATYDNGFFSENILAGSEAAADLEHAIHYFEKKNVKFISICGDLTVQQSTGDVATPFVFNDFPSENNNPTTLSSISKWSNYPDIEVMKVISSSEKGCNVPGQKYEENANYHNFVFSSNGQRFILTNVPHEGNNCRIQVKTSIIYKGNDVTSEFESFYSSLPIGFYSASDGKYHLNGNIIGNIKSYNDFNYSGLEIGISNSIINSKGWPTGITVDTDNPIIIRVHKNNTDGPFFVFTQTNEILSKSYLSDLDAYRYNALVKNATDIPIFVCRGNHDIGALRSAHIVEKTNRNANIGTVDEQMEKLWAYYTHPNNNRTIPSTLNIQYKDQEKGLKKEYCGNYYIHDTISDDIYIFFSLYNNDFWYGSDPYKSDDFAWLCEVLDEFRNKRTFVFLHLFFDDKCGAYKHIYPKWQDGGNSVMYINNQFLKLQWLSDYYKNSIWISGHSHWRWCNQSLEKYANIYHKSVNPELGEYGGWCIHIPSNSYPRTDDGDESTQHDINLASEGALIDIYKDYVEIHGIVFKDYKRNTEWSRLSNTTPSNQYIDYISGIANYRLNVGGKNLINIDSLI